MADKCECPHTTDISIIVSDHNRWKKLLDGNGHEAIGTRVRVLEDNQERNNKTMENLLESSENLRTSVSGLAKEYKSFTSNRKAAIGNIIQTIIIAIMAIGLVYEIFFK